MPFAQFGTENFNVSTVLCDVYEGVQSVTPLALAGSETDASSGISWALDKLAGVGIAADVLGCSSNAVSSYLYPNSSQAGGLLNLPPVSSSTYQGNNVYNKTYFCQPPTTPQCSHTCS